MSKILTDEEVNELIDYYSVKLKISDMDYVELLANREGFARDIEAKVLERVAGKIDDAISDCDYCPHDHEDGCPVYGRPAIDSNQCRAYWLKFLGGQNE